MTSTSRSIQARLFWLFDECLLRLDDAIDFARGGVARLFGAPVAKMANMRSPRAGYFVLQANRVHVDDLGLDVADPVDARRAMRLRQDRLAPIDPTQLDWAMEWSPQSQAWKVGMIRRSDLNEPGVRNGDAGVTLGMGQICEKDGARFVFRSPAQHNAWRRYRALIIASLLAFMLAIVGLSAAFEVRSARLLEHAQAERTRVLARIGDIPVATHTVSTGIAPHELVARLDLVADARPDGWRLLTLRQTETGWALLFDIPQQGDVDFLQTLQTSAAVATVTSRQLGVRNGVTRREFQIVWQEADE